MGVKVIGIEAPIIREGDDLVCIVGQAVLDAVHAGNDKHGACIFDLKDKDVIGITESVVARAQGNYVTVNDIVQFMTEHNYPKVIGLYKPIFSRNRFAIILKAIARYADKIAIYHDDYDEQGNPCNEKNPFTGVDIKAYYKEICDEEKCELTFYDEESFIPHPYCEFEIDARCHPIRLQNKISLADIMNAPIKRNDGTLSGFNSDYGLLGSNKADEETLKLFPRKEEAQKLVEAIQREFYENLGVHVEVMVYGDGCFKDPVGGIWEFADPVTTPGYTKGLEGTPNEIKVKYFADSKYKKLNGAELDAAITQEIKNHKNKNLVGNMSAEGTTPRRYVDLLASLMDLVSGSGMRCTPFVLVQNYFD